jgi:DNA-binding Lrp family transcriptional regulator
VLERRGLVRERVLRILLNNPSGDLTKYRVAKESEGTYPWIHELLEKLEKDGVVKGTRVKDFKKLIALWQKWQVRPNKKEYMLRNPIDILRKIKLQYALTTYQAENIVQNYLFPSRVDFYIRGKERDEWHRILSREGLVGRGNTRVLIGDEHVFYGSFERNGLRVVSLPQLVVDLLNEGGVCVEAAEKLLRKVSKNVLPRL